MADPPITTGSRWIDLHPALLTYNNLRAESSARGDPTYRDTFMRYVQHHRGRAHKLLDLWESEPTRADEFCGKSRTLSFVKSLRAFLSSHNLMPERPPGWVDPLGVDQYEAMKEVRMEMHELKKIKDQKESIARRLDKVRKQLTTAEGPSGINSDRLPHANHPLVRSTGAQVRVTQPTPQMSGQKRRNRNVKKRFFALEANNLRRVSRDAIRRTIFPREPDAETQGPDQETTAMDVDQPTATTSANQLPADPDPPMAVDESESDQSVVKAEPSSKKAKRSRSRKKKQKKIKAKLMTKVYVMARKWKRRNRIEVDESETSSSGVSDRPSDLESKEDSPTAGPSRDKSPPARPSTARSSSARSSPARSSPDRSSPVRTARSSPNRSSPARSSPARSSPARSARSSPDRSSPARSSPARSARPSSAGSSPARSPPVKSPAPAVSAPTQAQPGPSISTPRDRQASPEPPKTPPLRRNATEWDPELGRIVQVTDEHGKPMRRIVSPPGTNVILNYPAGPH
jgi:hypothetical protein